MSPSLALASEQISNPAECSGSDRRLLAGAAGPVR
jgi:hypothetical protein